MEMWKANNASHIPTAPTTTAARYTRPHNLESGNSSYNWLRNTGQVTSSLYVNSAPNSKWSL